MNWWLWSECGMHCCSYYACCYCLCCCCLLMQLVLTDCQATGSKSQATLDEPTTMAQWIWTVVLRLRLHASSWPTGCSLDVMPHDAAVHETIAHYLHGERQLALAAFLALVMSRCGHRSTVNYDHFSSCQCHVAGLSLTSKLPWMIIQFRVHNVYVAMMFVIIVCVEDCGRSSFVIPDVTILLPLLLQLIPFICQPKTLPEHGSSSVWMPTNTLFRFWWNWTYICWIRVHCLHH